MKKVGDLLAGFTFNKSSLPKLKTLIFYWSRENEKEFSWSDFINIVEKQSPMVFLIQVKEQIVGMFMY